MDRTERLSTRIPRRCSTWGGYTWTEFDCSVCGRELDRGFYCPCFPVGSNAKRLSAEEWDLIEKKVNHMMAKIFGPKEEDGNQ